MRNSTVSRPPTSRLGDRGTWTEAPAPLSRTALPTRPRENTAPLTSVPALPSTLSTASVPPGSSNLHCEIGNGGFSVLALVSTHVSFDRQPGRHPLPPPKTIMRFVEALYTAL